ncbi:hypothetical protein ACHWQZ_G003269 [Mnemiopsis leidyi]
MSHSIYTSAVIEKCLNYMKVETRRGANKDKIYKNKRLMVDRLILKIESCFPTVCDECTMEYKNTIHDSPPLTCFICWQGSHNCQAVQDFQRNIEQLGSKTGSSVENQSEQPTQTQGNDAIPRDNQTQRPPGNICVRYKNHNCPHGVSGKRTIDGRACPDLHPKLCRKYIRNGNSNRGGCQKGRDCRFYHPKLCKHSVNRRVCTVTDCKFTHLKGTKRKENHKENPRPNGRVRRDSDRRDGPSEVLPPLRQGILRQQRPRNDSITSNVSWRDTNTPMYPRLKDHVPKPKEKYELSFVVDLIEDLRGTQKEMERSIMELRQRLPVPVMNQPQSAPIQL